MPGGMNPVTLRFADDDAERKIRASQFQSTYGIYLILMSVVFGMHCWLPTVHPAVTMTSAVYIPVVAMALLGEYLCMKREMQDIPLLFGGRSRR